MQFYQILSWFKRNLKEIIFIMDKRFDQKLKLLKYIEKEECFYITRTKEVYKIKTELLIENKLFVQLENRQAKSFFIRFFLIKAFSPIV